MSFGKITFQRYLVPEGFLFVARSCRNGWFDCWTKRTGYGDLVHQFGFKPDKNNFGSAWAFVISNYDSGNILWQDL